MICKRGWLLGCWLAAGLSPGLALWPAGAAPFAERITARNVEAIRARGPDAHGGIGDWALSNGTLCAVVSDLDHESALATQGGVLIDVSHCGLADDHFVILQPQMNFSREMPLGGQAIRAEVDEREARIITSGSRGGVRFETRYSVSEDWPLEVRVVTTLARFEDGESVSFFGDISLHGNRQLTPFALVTSALSRSPGFAHPAIDVDNPLAMARAMGENDLIVLVGGDALDPGVSYGLQLRSATLERADGSTMELPHVSLHGTSFSLLGALTRRPWLGGGGKPGLLGLAQTLLMDLHEGDLFRYERAVLLGARSDVASITDQLWANEARVSGRVDDPAARLRVLRSDGTPATHVRPEPDGRFAFQLPPGSYRVQADAPGGRQSQVVEFQLPNGAPAEPEREPEPEPDRPVPLELAELTLGSPARLRLPSGTPMRLVFVGEGGTASPRFGDDFRAFRVGDESQPPSEFSNDVSLAGVEGDPLFVVVAPGRYRVYATRGIEYGVTQAVVEARAGETIELALQPPARVLRSPGWVSADLHVHSGLSDDSTLDPRVRIASFHAQGADILVTTEHDRVVDLAPLIRRMGLAAELRSIIGVEITTTVHNEVTPYSAGHHNLFPVRHLPHEYRGGAPAAEGRRLRTTIASARASGRERVFQLNHPRTADGISSKLNDSNFFTHLATAGTPFDPTLPLDAPANRPLSERDPHTQLRDLDFDVLELMNGSAMARYFATRADWFSLLLQGEVRPGTANSDSHGLRQIVALPLNYVRLAHDGKLDELDEVAFVRAVREGKLYGTTGPLLDVRLGSVGIGGLFEGARGTLHIRVDAAHWVPVSQARVYVNARLTHTIPIRASESRGVVLSFETDSFVSVEVEGEAGEIYRRVAPGFTPFAFANPIFVDADGDGVWSAPGLPGFPGSGEMPASISEPLAEWNH